MRFHVQVVLKNLNVDYKIHNKSDEKEPALCRFFFIFDLIILQTMFFRRMLSGDIRLRLQDR